MMTMQIINNFNSLPPSLNHPPIEFGIGNPAK